MAQPLEARLTTKNIRTLLTKPIVVSGTDTCSPIRQEEFDFQDLKQSLHKHAGPEQRETERERETDRETERQRDRDREIFYILTPQALSEVVAPKAQVPGYF